MGDRESDPDDDGDDDDDGNRDRDRDQDGDEDDDDLEEDGVEDNERIPLSINSDDSVTTRSHIARSQGRGGGGRQSSSTAHLASSSANQERIMCDEMEIMDRMADEQQRN